MTAWARTAATVVLSLTLAACLGTAPSSADSRSTHHIGDRTYRLYEPAGLTSAPLVLVLHGGFGTGRAAERSYGWDAQARSGRFAVAYPDGTARAWNAGTCCGRPSQTRVDDVGFLRRVVDDVARRTSIDRRRVFVAGMSNGAMMALRMVCQTSKFRGAASVSGTLVTGCARPASIIQIHGTADPRVPYRGGVGSGSARVDGEAIPSVDARFRRLAHCAPPTRTRHGSVAVSSARCPGGRAVTLLSIDGMGHHWPGQTQPSPLSGPPSSAINATAVIWRFFDRL
ncbi:extracellular catalytic domain type 1 short-chain-length polyhydroxyalkanoate depolymerase [Gordonia crocea]|uniref:Phospholipase/carboxylesterase/thioesterase domain-containing protein n=1 Tax=Gordonia crocea TaxID=589162 RepID=A0A7I9UXL2_9ACTN|nr:PHB depolymerase family esterase [Gordonia crocea]GED97682.1 hypothetical protein nbrc107697_17210 [Gordonia crocea]